MPNWFKTKLLEKPETDTTNQLCILSNQKLQKEQFVIDMSTMMTDLMK